MSEHLRGRLRATSGAALGLTGLTAAVVLAVGGGNAAAVGTSAGCQIFPADNHWNLPVDNLPVLPRSKQLVDSIGKRETVHPDFGSGNYQGAPIGIPITVVGPQQPPVPVRFNEFPRESDPGPYPIPSNAPIEGGDRSDGDRHVVVLQQGTPCRSWELYHSRRPGAAGGGWTAGSGAVWNLSSNALRRPGWTSADAAGLPILPGLARADEIEAGAIEHALRFTVPESRRKFIYPATHFASDKRSKKLPAMGQRFRLRSKINPADFPPQAAVVVRALKTYGMIVADNGSPWFISGAPSPVWDNDQLRELAELRGRDFVAVDTSKLPKPTP